MTRLVGCLLASGEMIPMIEGATQNQGRRARKEAADQLDVQMQSRSGKLKEGAHNTHANIGATTLLIIIIIFLNL